MGKVLSKGVLGMVMCVAGSSAMAQEFSDDFNRPNTVNWATHDNALPIGDKYRIETGAFRIIDNTLGINVESQDEKEIIFTGFPSEHGNGKTFTASVDIYFPQPGDDGAIGLAFDYSDHHHYYIVRFRGNMRIIQYAQLDDAAGNVLQLEKADQLEGETWYRLTLTSSKTDEFDYKLAKADSPDEALCEGTFVIPTAILKQGNFALQATGQGDFRFDNLKFSIK